MATTNSIQGVTTLNQGFTSNEIEDLYASHLNLNGFCTVDNELQGTAGDIRTINVYGAAGSAEKVTEGNGNTTSISTTLVEKQYQVECAQAWFKYSDEALLRDPVAVQTGVSKLGTSLFDQVNSDIYGEMAKASQLITPASLGFDAFVDAAAKIDFADVDANAREYQGRTIPTLWAILDNTSLAAARKAMKDQIVYDPTLAWNPGYVGSVAGIALFVKKNAADKMIYVGTDKAVTVFNKTGVETEIVSKNQRGSDDANRRLNNLFARKYYIAALTNNSQIVQVALPGASAHYVQKEDGDGTTTAFVLDNTATDTPVVYLDGKLQVSGTDYTYSSGTVTFTTAPAADSVVTIDYHYTVA